MDNNEEYIPLYMQGKYNNDKNKLESKPVSEQKAFAYASFVISTARSSAQSAEAR